jgi:lysyl-tRNA synthetase class II
MVSAFLCERYGLLALTPEMMAENEKMAAELCLAITDSTTVIYPDNKASGDDYWNMKQMIEQVSHFVPALIFLVNSNRTIAHHRHSYCSSYVPQGYHSLDLR